MFYRGLYEPILSNNWSQWVQLRLSVSVLVFLGKPIAKLAIVIFQGGSGSPVSPLDPLMHGCHVWSKSYTSLILCVCERRTENGEGSHLSAPEPKPYNRLSTEISYNGPIKHAM